MFKKKKILDIESVYTANAFRNDLGFYIGAGSETKDEVYLYDMSTGESSPIPRLPGGMMSFVPIPGKPNLFVTVMGLFPPFIGEDAGIWLHSRMETNWESGMAFSLPFAHRCEAITAGGKHYLIAASVSRHKEDPADWSQPGEIHVLDLENCEYKKWKSDLIDNTIIRNHGMIKGMQEGREVVYVSGEQGIFSIGMEQGEWKLHRVFEGETSEFSFIDIDGDGKEELATIEPFHGNTLNIYKNTAEGWDKKFSGGLEFGHGLSSGSFNSEPVIVTGNRAGSFALEAFFVKDLQSGSIERKLIEEGAGPTQTQVFTYDSKDYILSANQKKNEVALYY